MENKVKRNSKRKKSVIKTKIKRRLGFLIKMMILFAIILKMNFLVIIVIKIVINIHVQRVNLDLRNAMKNLKIQL